MFFLPANTTSKLQPLDLGIIMNFKAHYRKLLMQFVLARIEECSSATEVTKSISILQAIRWVAQAWSHVSLEVIQKCFRKAGILDKDFKARKPAAHSDDDDPFAALEEDDDSAEDVSGAISDLQELVSKLDESCSAAEFIAADNDLQVHIDDVDWEGDFLAQIGPTSSKRQCQDNVQESDEEDEGEEESTVIEPRLNSLSEALTALKDAFEFLDHKGFTTEATQVMCVVSTVASLCHTEACRKNRQTTLDHFIHQ